MYCTVVPVSANGLGVSRGFYHVFKKNICQLAESEAREMSTVGGAK